MNSSENWCAPCAKIPYLSHRKLPGLSFRDIVCGLSKATLALHEPFDSLQLPNQLNPSYFHIGVETLRAAWEGVLALSLSQVRLFPFGITTN